MKEKRWKSWSIFLVLLAGTACLLPSVKCQSYGDDGDVNVNTGLGFSGIEERHDGYVKGEVPTIPQTSFSCSAQPYNPGLYADMETNCQVYHVCFADRQESFLCGPGTNFNQRILACDFWYNFECQNSASFYAVNADIGKVPETSYRPPDQPRVPDAQRPSYPGYPQEPDQRPYQPAPPPPPRQPQPPRPRPQPQPQRPQPPPHVGVPPPPPRVQPPPPPRPRPQPRPQPQPRPPTTQVQVRPQYPRVPAPSGQAHHVRPSPPRQPPIQQEEDGYQFEGGYQPPRPAPRPQSPPPSYPVTPRPVFPPVVSPPRVSRPPLTPPVVRQPEGSIQRPQFPAPRPSRPDYQHPDSNIKGSTDFRPPQQPPRVPQQPPRVPQPSRPVGTGYPTYPVPQRPVVTQQPRPQVRPQQPPSRPTTIQQEEHIDTDYVPHPPPPPRQPPRRPPPPPRQPVRQPPPPPRQPPPRRPAPPPSRPYVPPPVPQRPIEPDYVRPQPPIAPSIITERQKPASQRPPGPQVGTAVRPPQQPQRPRPVFPPASDHPNSNMKGGPGYQQPPPPPRFEPTRIGRPSVPTGQQYPSPPTSVTAVKPTGAKKPSTGTSISVKPPTEGRVKKPSEPPTSIYQPPIQHPSSEIKGNVYQPPVVVQQPPPRIPAPSVVTGVKRPQVPPAVQRPRAPVVVSRPQPPPSLPSTSIKKTQTPVGTQVYEKPRPPAVTGGRVKSPSTQVQKVQGHTSQPRFPAPRPVDHPNANVKGGGGYQQPRPQVVRTTHVTRPVGPPSLPSISYEQKTVPTGGCVGGQGYQCPRGDGGYVQPNTIPSTHKVPQVSTGVKDVRNQRPISSAHHTIKTKQPQPDYDPGTSYTRGPDVYPKPEFGQSNAPHPPTATKQVPSSQNTITQTQVKSTYQGAPASTGTGTHVRPDYPFREVPGHQPPHQPQVFPHRDNPDHPNESIKGSGAYRPPPPAGFQAAASEEQESIQLPELDQQPDPSSPLLGDIGAE